MRAILLAGLFSLPAHQGTAAPSDPGAHDACLSCHQTRDPALVTAWHQSRHRTEGVGCPACHGTAHTGEMAARARHNETCTLCHTTEETKSYQLSKHGVIATLEAAEWNFSLPLRDGNLRAPTCAYCHLHQGNHDAGAIRLPLAPMEGAAPVDGTTRAEARAAPCRDCHSPRLVTTWFESGARLVEIGHMKVREAAAVVAQMNPNAERTQKAHHFQKQMQDERLRHLNLGVGHQSPDHQWWHGHPALDGLLLRIKSLLSEQQLDGLDHRNR